MVIVEKRSACGTVRPGLPQAIDSANWATASAENGPAPADHLEWEVSEEVSALLELLPSGSEQQWQQVEQGLTSLLLQARQDNLSLQHKLSKWYGTLPAQPWLRWHSSPDLPPLLSLVATL